MTAIVIIVFTSLIIFLIMSAVFYYSLSNLKDSQITTKETLKFSILIAAKNEAVNLQGLFESLKNIQYATDLFEIILIDDNSTDDTFQVAQSFKKELNNLTVLKTSKHDFLVGKKAALATGIKQTKFDNVVITDADCEVPKAWLNELSSQLADNDVVIGVAPLKQTKSLVNKISTFENLKTHQLVFSFANIKQPYSAAARNFAFKKSIYDKLGGYESVNETIGGDDDLLLREAIKHNLKVGIMTSKDSFVYSHSKNTFAEYLRQKGRHTSTSHHYLFKHKMLLGLWHLTNLICLFSFLLSLFSSIFVLPIIIKLLVDYLITNSFQNKFGYSFTPLELTLLNILNEFLIIINFINSFRFKRRWN